MTVGEKLMELFPGCKCRDGVYEFMSITERDSRRCVHRHKCRLDNEFVTAPDGSDYAMGRLDKANIGIRRVFNIIEYQDHVRAYGEDFINEQKAWILGSMVMGIASKQCKMLSPIYITYYVDGINIIYIGTAFVEERLIDKLRYPNYEVAQG